MLLARLHYFYQLWLGSSPVPSKISLVLALQEQTVIISQQQADTTRHDCKAAQHALVTSKQELQQCQKQLEACQLSIQQQKGLREAASKDLCSLQAQIKEVPPHSAGQLPLSQPAKMKCEIFVSVLPDVCQA